MADQEFVPNDLTSAYGDDLGDITSESISEDEYPESNQVIRQSFFLAEFDDRLVACFLDGLILFLVSLAYVLLFRTIYLYLKLQRTNLILTILYIGLFLVQFLYQWFFLSRFGATLGKMLLGLQVMKHPVSARLTFKDIVVREYLGKLISVLFFGLGFLWVKWDKSRQAWHDKIAGTIVIRK